MKYAIVKTAKAEAMGIKHAHHVKNPNKKLMIMNENELRQYGDPAEIAAVLDGELMGIKEINKIKNSKTWSM